MFAGTSHVDYLTKWRFLLNVMTGHCNCRAISIKMRLSRPLADYQPRQCDCDFCTQRGILYLSDVDGFIAITVKTPVVVLTQGSQQAEFLQCTHCQTVVAVKYQTEKICLGAVNVALFSERSLMQQPLPVSPKQLPASEKLQRWLQLWTPLQLSVSATASR